MSSMLKNLNNTRLLRIMARKFFVNVPEDMLEKFKVVTKGWRDEEGQIQRQRIEQQAKINTPLVQTRADGISPGKLLSITPATARSIKKRRPHPVKYRFIDLNGEMKIQTGQGRIPKPVARAPAVGKSFGDFSI